MIATSYVGGCILLRMVLLALCNCLSLLENLILSIVILLSLLTQFPLKLVDRVLMTLCGARLRLYVQM